MTENKDAKVFDLTAEDEFRAYIQTNISENLNHARHVETEIHTFTGIYMAVVAGVLAFDFSRQGELVGVLVHVILLFGGLIAIYLLDRWYTAFDTFMAYASCLGLLEQKMLVGKMSIKTAVTRWNEYTEALKAAIEKGEAKPAKVAMGVFTPEEQSRVNCGASMFAYDIPRKHKGRVRTRNFIFMFHSVILLSILLIVVTDLYGLLAF